MSPQAEDADPDDCLMFVAAVAPGGFRIPRKGDRTGYLWDFYVGCQERGQVAYDLELQRWQEELADYDELEARFGQDTLPAIQIQVAYGLFNGGALLADLGRIDEAVQRLEMLPPRFAGTREPEVEKVLHSAARLRRNIGPR